MVRTAVSAALLLSTFATHAAHAQEVPDDDTVSAASDAGVSPTDLLGAMNTLEDAGYANVDARQYLATVGELAVAPPTPPAAPVIQVYDVWDLIARCESGGNWAANTGNGYLGGLQFDLDSWRRAGGVGRPDQASRATQIAVAQHWQALIGWKAWPVCSRRLGLR